jgi:GR25 family glycosyltransferase involved in LPS biosynthesis
MLQPDPALQATQVKLSLDKIHLKVINLQHRADRRQECIGELRKVGMDASDNVFFEAKSEPDFGALGCALSHAKVLADFLFRDDKPFALILEDDFLIRDAATFVSTVTKFCNQDFLWDVFLLGHNSAVPIEPTHFENAVRVVNSQTASGYLVGRLYAIKLIDYFFRSAELLRRYQYLPEPNKAITKSFFSCDILWKELQIKDRFVVPLPSLIVQRPSYSDIEKRNVDYGV